MVWDCSVCELRCLNSKKQEKEEEKMMKNFGAYEGIGIFPFPCMMFGQW